jgi:hypothetical protein
MEDDEYFGEEANDLSYFQEPLPDEEEETKEEG